MDKKKTIGHLLFLVGCIICLGSGVSAQTSVKSLSFRDRSYGLGAGNDSIKIYFNVFGENEKRISNISVDEFKQYVTFREDGVKIENPQIRKVSSGVRIPKDLTFSVLLDQSIPDAGKRRILEVVKQFVEAAPDSCVYVSFYGNEVTNSIEATTANFSEIENKFMEKSTGKVFYSGVYSKLVELANASSDLNNVRASCYQSNPAIGLRAAEHPGKNYLMVFAEGSLRPDDENLDIIDVTDLQNKYSASLPKVYAFYYTADGEDTKIERTLKVITHPLDSNNELLRNLVGSVSSSVNMEEVLNSFKKAIEDAKYDYELLYFANAGRTYTGNVNYDAEWGNYAIGSGKFTIGSAEKPWPEKERSASNMFVELLVAVLVTAVTFAFFYLIMKIIVPYIRFMSFKSKYYKKYQAEANVQRRICHYCKQEIRPGQVIVTKCSHWMHKHCWEENDYKCAEFGQNCKTGKQDHIEWDSLFKASSLRECSQTIAGVLAGLAGWIAYEICGRGGFTSLSRFIVGLVFNSDDPQSSLIPDCEIRTSSFLTIGLLLGLFISMVFRYKDDIRNKNLKVWFKIIGLSILTGLIGMLSFAIGSDLFCLILSWTGESYIPWYCSLPAYILFSINVSLALTIKSSIPVRSALLGGTISAFIGFLVLYFSKFSRDGYEWLNMLLDFIIYGGGLGASLITVRMLAEKYFLVIMNGIKMGQRIPIHKWMNATGGGNKVSIGMTGECEIQMNWEKTNKVAKEHAQLYIDHEKTLPVIKPLATGVLYNTRAELPVNRPAVLSNGDTFKIGDTIFKYEEI